LDSGTDGRQFSNQIVDYLRNLMLVKIGNSKDVEAPQEVKKVMQEHSNATCVEKLAVWIRIFNQAQHNLGSRWQPSLALELAVVECLEEPAPVVKVDSERPTSIPTAQKNIGRPVSRPAVEKKSEETATKPIGQTKEKEEISEITPEKGGGPQDVQKGTQAVTADGRSTATEEEELRNRWKEIRALVKKEKPHTEALLNSCKSIHLEGQKLKLGFESDLLKTKMDSDANREITRKAIHDLLILDVQVECEVVKGKNGNHSNQPNGQHGNLVNTAISLGGEIIDKE